MKKSLLNNFIYFFNLIYKKELSYGVAGNASLRKGNTIYITPKGPPKEGLKIRDLIKFNLNSKKIPENVSSDVDFHLWVYKNFKKINSIFHAHTFYSNFITGKNKKFMFDEAINMKNLLVLSTEKWKKEIENKMNENIKVLHIKNHGIFSFGNTPAEAFSFLIHYENLCKISYFAKSSLKIREAQKVIYDTYFKRDSKREFLKNVLWFSEEVGEFLQAIRKGREEKIKEEISDVLAWLLTIANLLNIDLEEEFHKKYVPFCPRCKKSPCECPER